VWVDGCVLLCVQFNYRCFYFGGIGNIGFDRRKKRWVISGLWREVLGAAWYPWKRGQDARGHASVVIGNREWNMSIS
jgi:hypothetical protein